MAINGLKNSRPKRYKKNKTAPKLTHEIILMEVISGNFKEIMRAAIITQRKLEYPSTRGNEGCQTKPLPLTNSLAYPQLMKASSVVNGHAVVIDLVRSKRQKIRISTSQTFSLLSENRLIFVTSNK